MIPQLDSLVRTLSRLPGIGRKSAERAALRIAYSRDGLLRDLVAALVEVGERVRSCSRCGGITSVEEDPCILCTDSARDGSVVCVVEEPADVISIESAGGVHGRYHVLMGKLSPAVGKGPWDIRLERLLQRIKDEGFKEVILALGTDMESDATASFIHDLLKERDVKVTRLAFGLPVGIGVSFSDPVTLERAIRGRQNM